MEIEKQRGISVASSVMQMEYRDCVINLLDTPGHQDFSEDTYRVLTAVDAALMVIDAANGVEPQTRRLLQVCRARNTPILTFVNKMDREVQEPLALMDEIERELGMSVVPFTWPVGMGKCLRRRDGPAQEQMRVFSPGEDRKDATTRSSTAWTTRLLPSASAGAYEQAAARSNWCAAPRPPSTRPPSWPATRRRCSSARRSTTSACARCSTRWSTWRRRPARAPRSSAWCSPTSPSSPAWSSRSRPTWTRRTATASPSCAWLSGHFERGMRLKVVRSGKELRPNTVVSFLSQRRELLDEAFAGDIIGIPNHGVLQLGDTLTEGEALQFTGLPFFAPEMFRSVEVADPLKTKQLRAGLTQLGEEGAIQVFRPVAGTVLLLGAVGQLQFEVVAHRLEHEYGVQGAHHAGALQRGALGDLRDDGGEGAQALHRRQRAPRGLRRGDDAPRAAGIRRRAARDAGQLAEDPVPRAARARGAGVPEAPRRSCWACGCTPRCRAWAARGSSRGWCWSMTRTAG
jgi:peptide chain release factor 3